MRRAIAAALAAMLLTAGIAQAGDWATVALIDPRKSIGTDATAQGTRRYAMRNAEIYSQVMDRLGIHYKRVKGNGTNVEQVRLGVFGNSALGTASFTADGIVIPDLAETASDLASYPGFRADSLTKTSRGGMRKPSLWLLDNSVLVHNIASDPDSIASAGVVCSLGVSLRSANSVTSGAVLEADQSIRFQPSPYHAGFVRLATANLPHGGLRVHLRSAANGRNILGVYTAFNSQWPDSMPFLEDGIVDTMLVWERMWDNDLLPANCQGAEPMIFASWCGAGGQIDSVSSAGNQEYTLSEGSYEILMVAFARLDSLIYASTGKRLITKPLQGAFVVDGFLNNSVLGAQRGRDDADTLQFYRSLDSLSAWGIPFTGGVNTDSAASYARDLILMKRLSKARWTPQVWTGIQDTTLASVASAKRPIDVFGHYRNRVAYGPADTTTSSLLAYAGYRLDSLGLRRSRTLLPPMLDYSPKQCVQGDPRAFTRSDSVLYAASLLGYSAVVVNSNEDQSNPAAAVSATNVRGWRNVQGRIMAHGVPFKVIGSFSTFPSRAASQQVAVITGVETFTYFVYGSSYMQSLLFNRYKMDRDVFVYDSGGITEADWYGAKEDIWNGWMLDREQYPHRGSAVRFNCDMFSGTDSNPAKTGLWMMKSLWNASRAANALAGRPVWTWGYPENIEP